MPGHIFNQTLPIMLASCLMLLGTHYAQNYAGIIGRSLLQFHKSNLLIKAVSSPE